MALFRWHRGSLEGSMETIIRINNFEELLRLINSQLPFNIKFEREDIKIKHYGFDRRISQEVYIVSSEKHGVIGWTDGLLDE